MKKKGLWAQCSQLHFTPDQLQQLNLYFSNMESCQDFKQNQTLAMIEAEVDRLVQYLVYKVGDLDDRFSSEFLVKLEPTKIFVKGNNSFSYLIRLDNLSVSNTNKNNEFNFYLDYGNELFGTQGFAKIKLENETYREKWRELITRSGYLRSDRMQKKFTDLLRKAQMHSNIDNNSSSIISSRGKIFDAESLYHILNIPLEERMFYRSPKEPQPFKVSDLRKYHLDISETNGLIKLRITFLSEDLMLDEGIDVSLLFGLGLQGWPSISDYPHRISLCNSDVLLHQQMATTGFFLISACSARLTDKKSHVTLWQFFFPTIDCIFENHYSQFSCVLRSINIVYIVLLNLRRTTPGGHTVGKYILKILTWLRVESLNENQYWISDFLSNHVISMLDDLVNCLRNQFCRSYYFEKYNALINSFRCCTGQYSFNDFKDDADIIETFIQRIHALSSSELIGHQMICGERRLNQFSQLEQVLIHKWQNLMNTMTKNSKGVKGKGTRYVRQQIEYIVFLFRALLITRSVIIPFENHCKSTTHATTDYSKRILLEEENLNIVSVDDICYIVTLICDQAKQHFLNEQRRKKLAYKSYSFFNSFSQLPLNEKLEKKHQEIVNWTLGRIRENPLRVIKSELHAVTLILQVLYEAADMSKLSRSIFNPFLKLFFEKSHQNCWFLGEWKNRLCNDELTSLRIFSKLISRQEIKCEDALVEALQKNWDWALEIINICIKTNEGQFLIFSTEDKDIEHRVSFTEDEISTQVTRHRLNALKYGYRNAVKKLCEILKFDEKREYCEEEGSPGYEHLDGNPITRVIDYNRRKGFNLGLGNIIFSLIALGKFTVLQEITDLLPEEKRHRSLECIQHTLKMKQRHDKEIQKSMQCPSELYKIYPDYLRRSKPSEYLNQSKSANNFHLQINADNYSVLENFQSDTCKNENLNSKYYFNVCSMDDTRATNGNCLDETETCCTKI